VDHESGKSLAVYLQVRKGRAAKVKELVDGAVFANYSRGNVLLGVEILAPVSVAVFDGLTSAEPREVKEFFVNKLPRDLAIGA
jgi:hypothetical protein